jgi:NAD(P)-dependent dehydrogenase (short-subunit alcohol dehydrogenase family)
MRRKSKVPRWALTAILSAMVAGVFVRRRRRRSVHGQVALVTGGSRGLGFLIAEELGRRGVRLVICARDPGELDRARARLSQLGAEVRTVAVDLEQPSEVDRVVEETRAAFGKIDILINNAGVMEVGPHDEMSEDAYGRAMALHFWAPLRLIRAVVPEMKARGDGRIVNVSSIGGKLAVPHMLPYTTSKFALTGLSEGLCAELAKDGISVTTVCPGLMRTGSVPHALFKGRREQELAAFESMAATPLTSMGARRAASKIVRATLDRRSHLVLTWQGKLAAALHGLMPGVVARALGWANRLLPAPVGDPDGPAIPGREIESQVPSWLTRLTTRAGHRYNET